MSDLLDAIRKARKDANMYIGRPLPGFMWEGYWFRNTGEILSGDSVLPKEEADRVRDALRKRFQVEGK